MKLGGKRKVSKNMKDIWRNRKKEIGNQEEGKLGKGIVGTRGIKVKENWE